VSDIDTAVVDSLKVLDLKWPIREADIRAVLAFVRYWTNSGHRLALALNDSVAIDPLADIAGIIMPRARYFSYSTEIAGVSQRPVEDG
jgi:hypothetical protein